MKKIINESVIKFIVAESLRNILREQQLNELMDNMGKLGKLTPSMLSDPQDLFSEEYKMREEDKSKGTHIDIPSRYGNTLAYNIWKQYVVAMLGTFNISPDHRPISVIKKRKGIEYFKTARGFFGWLDDIKNGKIDRLLANGKYPILAYKNGNGYIFGHFMEGFFIVCYISPEEKKSMELAASLCQYSNVGFMITLDMAPILEGAGLFTDGKIYKMKYSGHLVDKKIFGTSQEALDFVLLLVNGGDILRKLQAMGISKDKISSLRNQIGTGNIKDLINMLRNGSTI